MKTKYIQRSNRHVHLTEETAKKLNVHTDMELSPLMIDGQFSTNKFLEIPKLGKTRVLYPWREYDVLEVSMTEYFKLFKEYTDRRHSNQVEGARQILISEYNVSIPTVVVIPHMHMPKHLVCAVYKEFPLPLHVKLEESTVEDKCYIHVDQDQYNGLFNSWEHPNFKFV